MTDTPRTDEFAKRCREEHPVTGDGRCLEFARQLERENNRLRLQVKELAQEIYASARDAFAEGQWSARQGDDYGSY